MAKPGAGKLKMQAVRKKQWNNTTKSLKRTGRALKKGFKVSKRRKKGCYVATCVYGSYDCPEVWTLRRYRDNVLDKSLIGKLFIRSYYFVSPTMVRIFGKNNLIKNHWKTILDRFVQLLNRRGFENTPYSD